MLEKTEIVFGPSSTIYGSDALGGTIHFMTRNPMLDPGRKKPVSLRFFQRYSTVNKGLGTHFDLNLGAKKMASLTSVTYNKFGDLNMGKRKNPFFDTLFGLRTMYAERISGKDSGVLNNDQYLQKQSGYSQVDLLQKFLYKQSNTVEHLLNIQYSTSSNIPRYDRLTEIRQGKPRYAEWYYGPQERLLTAYDLSLKNTAGFYDIRLGLNYQLIGESRVSRNFGSNNLDSRKEKVGVFGYHLDFRKLSAKGVTRFGLDGQANTLTSTATRENIVTNARSPLSTRYPDGENTLNHHALYITHTMALSDHYILNGGARAGKSVLNSEVEDNSFFHLPVTRVKQDNITYSGYLGLVFNPSETARLSYQVSSGYRVPNIDDLAKIFETASGNVIIPNPGLKPEQTLTNEFGLTIKPAPGIRVETVFWYTLFYNAITTGPSRLNGQDSIVYFEDSTKSRVYANVNTARARLFGYSVSVNADVSKNGQIYFNLAYTRGEVIPRPSSLPHLPLDHISPVTGNVGYLHNGNRLQAEAYLLFNGKKDITDFSASGEDNQLYAPKSGIPAWITANIRLGYQLPRHLKLQAGVENILDTNYRVFASGINGPGRNVYVTLSLNY